MDVYVMRIGNGVFVVRDMNDEVVGNIHMSRNFSALSGVLQLEDDRFEHAIGADIYNRKADAMRLISHLVEYHAGMHLVDFEHSIDGFGNFIGRIMPKEHGGPAP